MLDWDNGEISTRKEYEIVVPLFGAAFAAPNKGSTTILYWFRSLSTVLSSTENRRIQGLFKTLEWFSSIFQGRFNFHGRKPSKFKYFSSMCEPWKGYKHLTLCMLGNFVCFFFVVCWFLFSIIFSKFVQEYHQSVKWFTFVWFDS